MSLYAHDKNRIPDSEFESGQLEHLVIGNEARLLDPRRTPVVIVDLLPAVGMFVIRIAAFEDQGALWEVPFEDVSKYQFRKTSKRTDPILLSEIKKAVERFDRILKIECAPETQSATLKSLRRRHEETSLWLEAQSEFFAQKGTLANPEERSGDALLAKDLQKFLKEKDLLEIENDFARQFVSNPHAGEIVKGHRIVLAELGLVAYEGKIQRHPDLFGGQWSRERRQEHVLWRMSFVQSIFRKLGHSHLCLYRGMSYRGELQSGRNQTFVSATFSKSVAQSHFEAGDAESGLVGVMFRQWTPVARLFMTYYETDQMNVTFKEAEAVLLFEGDSVAF